METNNIINIPEGYEIDKEQSIERQIVLKKIKRQIVLKKIGRPRTWEEYCKKMEGKDSYIAEVNGIVSSSQFLFVPYLTEFANKEDAMAFIAFDKLIKLRRDWIGDWNPDWTSDDIKYTIIIENNHIVGFINRNISRPMSFPTREMRNEFIECFKDLIEQAKRFI